MYAHATQVNPLNQQKQYSVYDDKIVHILWKLWPTSSRVGIAVVGLINWKMVAKVTLINFYQQLNMDVCNIFPLH